MLRFWRLPISLKCAALKMCLPKRCTRGTWNIKCLRLKPLLKQKSGMCRDVPGAFSFVVSALARLPLLIAFLKLRQSIHAVRKQLAGLPTFDVRTTCCKLDSDREFVEGRITAWYGSIDNFNGYVRERFQHSLAQSVRLPYISTLLSIAVPLLFSCRLRHWL